MKQFMIKAKNKCYLILVTLLFIFLCSCEEYIPDYIATSATVEAGNRFRAEDFLLEKGHTAEFAEEFAHQFAQDGIAKINKIGDYSVEIIVDGKNYSIQLTVQDTISPKAVARVVTVSQGDTLTAEQCVTDITDQTEVSCVFQSEPDFTQIGSITEIVILTDEAGNCTEIPVSITILGVQEILAAQYTIEAGSDIPTVNELLGWNRIGNYVTDVSSINTSLIGNYTLEIEIDDSIYTTELIIEDTIAPTAEVCQVTAYCGAVFPVPESFVSNINDEGPVTVSYEQPPGEIVSETTSVRIILTDQSGNCTVYESMCNVAEDNEAPEFILFPEHLEADVDSTIIWRAMVEVEDNSGQVELTLDTSGIDITKPGTYTVFFVAKDLAGNETRQEVTLVLHDNTVTKEMMDEVCAKILGQIITENMTTQEMLYAVWNYVVSHIKYTSNGVHDDVRREAYLGLTTRKNGDCFTYCAASEELLSYLGFETQIVRRKEEFVKTSGNHFWVLVNCGTDEEPLWYHHDASPHKKPYDMETYMMTDAQLKAYTDYRAETSSFRYYYSFDTSLYPASALEIVVDWEIDAKYFE